MNSPEGRVRLALSESERLKEYVSGLSEDAWSRPTACDRWDVRDMVAHLVLATEFQMGMISRGLDCDSSPPPGFHPAGASKSGGAGANATHRATIGRRDTLGDHLHEVFESTSDDMDRLLAGIGPSNWDPPCYHSGAIVPVRSYLDLRIMELIMHGWDIRSKLESEAHLEPESLPAFMDLLPLFVNVMLRPEPPTGAPTRLRFDLSPVAQACDIVVDGSTARVDGANAADPDVTFKCDPEAFVLVMWGRESMDSAIADGRMIVDEANAVATDFSRWATSF